MSKLAILAVLLSLCAAAEAQPSCALNLVPCIDYLNSTGKPPDSCCNPIKDAVTNELSCLCNLYNTPGLLATFNVSVDQALRLTRNCGITNDLSACNTSAPSPTSRNSPTGTTGGDNGVTGLAASTAFTSLLLFWAYTMIY